jgi:PPOX class probable F420-dependent enzyme
MSFENVARAKFLSLVTTKRDGTVVPTAVWFAQVGDALVVGTDSGAGKVKRIRHTPKVTVAPSNFRGRVTGPSSHGMARVADESESTAARAALAKKYSVLWRFFDKRIDAFVMIDPA